MKRSISIPTRCANWDAASVGRRRRNRAPRAIGTDYEPPEQAPGEPDSLTKFVAKEMRKGWIGGHVRYITARRNHLGWQRKTEAERSSTWLNRAYATQLARRRQRRLSYRERPQGTCEVRGFAASGTTMVPDNPYRLAWKAFACWIW